MKIKNKAFTLIELLVVIAIIGLLAGAVSVAFSQARIKARNVTRVSDAKAILAAAEAYNTSTGKYPVTGATWNYNSCHTTLWPQLEGVLSGYISKLPHDPKEDCTGAVKYYYRSNAGYEYKILMHNPEDVKHPPSDNLIDPARDSGSNASIVDGTNPWSWALYSPGAATW